MGDDFLKYSAPINPTEPEQEDFLKYAAPIEKAGGVKEFKRSEGAFPIPQYGGGSLPKAKEWVGAGDATMRLADYLHGGIRTLGAGVGRAVVPGGKKFTSMQDWKDALQGKAKAFSEFAIDSGYKPSVWQQIAMDLGGGLATDPLIAAKALKLVGPAGKLLQKTGKRIYRMPFKSTETILEHGDKAIPKGRLTDVLFDEGVGGYGKSSRVIRDEVDTLREKAWQPITDTFRKSRQERSLVPHLDDGVREARIAAITNNKKLTTAQKIRKTMEIHNSEVPTIKWINDSMDDVANFPETVKMLKEVAPEFAGVFDEVAKLSKTKTARKHAKTFLTEFLDDIGQKTTRTPKDIMNMRKVLVRKIKQKDLDPNYRHLLSVAERKLKSIHEGMALKAGMKPEAYAKANQMYGLLGEAKKPLRSEMLKAASKNLTSKLDTFLIANAAIGGAGGAMVGGGNLKDPSTMGGGVFGAFLTAYLAQKLRSNPTFATTVGKTLHKMGKTNLWDRVPTRAMLDARARGDENKPALPTVTTMRGY